MAMTARKKRMSGSAFMFWKRGNGNVECLMLNVECHSRQHHSTFTIQHSTFLVLEVLMRDIRSLFAEYASYHQTKGNKLFHRLGIPLIMLAGIGMLARAGVGHLNARVAVLVVAEVVYFRLEWRPAVAMLLVSVAFYFAGWAIPFWINVALFVLGWIFQFVGHSVYEHKSPNWKIQPRTKSATLIQ